MTCFRTY